MARPLLILASVFTFLILVLAAAGFSMLDLVLTDEPGVQWEVPFSFVHKPLWIEAVPDEDAEERPPARCRVTCYEADGQVREFLLSGDQLGGILESYLLGFSELEVEAVDGDAGPDTDLSREWE